ncbi:hypothetical protein KV112_06945 [Mycolicibacter sp. MYC123]|uniref:Glycosyltransferase n=1 Tax=[Mycobacterium] zoologicum TaxID=2872311 RepID=A0ABU5YL65_9MYCO|nr:hypothetical protein [Mycolicibacter sp. MYC123]MEB3049478.1 hypothetical protein [Mycolicibacter sp. MYC123]
MSETLSSGDRPEEVSAAFSSARAPEDFDESAYLAAFPDVAKSIESGHFRSALQHFNTYGKRERRLIDSRYEAIVYADTAGFPPANVDRIFVSKGGQCLVLGWVNDDGGRSISKLIVRDAHGLRGSTTKVYRHHREDVTAVLNLPENRHVGFWTIFTIENPEIFGGSTKVTLLIGAERRTLNCEIHQIDGENLRDIALEYMAKAQALRSPVETFIDLDAGLGSSLIALNIEVSRQMALGAQTVQIGVPLARPEASIIVCLFGKPEMLMIQCALFSKCRGIENYEFIYVSNSPEMADLLIKDATIANRIYGTPITLVIMPGNAGFGVANNAGAEAARSDRLLLMNPDVFPMDLEWPLQHHRLVNDLPAEQVALFGAPLYYDDGSLMHGGMYFEVDVGFAFRDQQAMRYDMLRVEHYGKGAPPHTNPFLVSRPVPAVSGAFMAFEREWFETLGGFSPEYIYTHYEDADLCLKSFSAGKPAWLHHLPFLHLESKGSIYRPLHGGGRLVNRWHFTKLWGEVVKKSIHGPAPQEFSTTTGH